MHVVEVQQINQQNIADSDVKGLELMSSNISGATLGKQKYEKSYEKINSKSRELKPCQEYQLPLDCSQSTRQVVSKKKSNGVPSSKEKAKEKPVNIYELPKDSSRSRVSKSDQIYDEYEDKFHSITEHSKEELNSKTNSKEPSFQKKLNNGFIKSNPLSHENINIEI